MGNTHPIANHWPTSHEKTVTCGKCNVSVDGLEYVADTFVNDPRKKTYIFYDFSHEERSMTVSSSTDGPSVSENIPEGTPLVKAFRRDGKKHMCLACFESSYPVVFKSVALSLNGKAALVNSDYTLHPASYGSGKK